MMSTTQAVPTPVDQNPAWQQVNKEMGVNFKMTPAQIADYPVKLNAVIAGGQLPDLMSISTGKIVANLPGFLDALCQDLTPFLSGDAVKEFPNLANMPPYAWPNTIFNGKIYCVPAVRTGITGSVMFAKGKLTDAAGGIKFKDKDDFMARMKALTIGDKQWGLGVTSGQANGTPNAASWFTQVFGAPNKWRNQGGKLTKDFETDEFKAAIDYARQLWAAGMISPDSTNQTVNQAGGAFYAGKTALWQNGFIIGDTVWNRANQQDPDFNLQAVIPFSPDGGKTKPVQHLGSGIFYLTVLKKTAADKAKLALNVLNYLAAPFGTAEQLLINYGVKDVDFKFDAKGNPVQTSQGTKDNIYNTMNNLCAPASVLYDAQDADYAKVMFPAEKTLQEMGIQDPTVGLYSKTDSEKSAVLNQKMGDGLNAIIFGKDQMSSFDQLVKDWRSGGGDQMRAEFQQALQARG
jgi:putative aldouronate transport system substrate-binding protein